MKLLLTAALLCLSVVSFAQAKPATATTKPATTKPAPATNTKPAIKPATTAAKPALAKAPAKPKPIVWADLDLNTANPPLPLIIKAPTGSTLDYDEGLVITGADSTYAVVIDMSYSDAPKSIAERKKEAQDNGVFKLVKFLVDKPDMLLYEVKFNGKSEYHFEVAKALRGEKFYLHDRWLTDKAFTLKEIEAMAESAKGLRVP